MNNSIDKQLLFIPVETKVREFQAKLLLACYAADAGFKVIIGEQVELLRKVKSMAPGIYIDKGIPITKLRHVKALRQFGHRIVAWCEEGLVMFSQQAYARDRVCESVLSEMERFFAWGEEQAGAILMAAPGSHDKIILTGNPRFDLLRKPFRDVFLEEANSLCDAHGNFILINTNFGVYNNFMGHDYFISKLMEGHGRFQDDQHKQFFVDLADYVRQNYDQYCKMTKKLSVAFPDRQFILRPHPSENHDAWNEQLKGLPNVKVLHDGNVIPWLMACDVLIHHSCTTSVEAFVLGKPVISYQPLSGEAYEPKLPSKVSVTVKEEEKLVFVLNQMLSAADNPVKQDNEAKKDEQLFGYHVDSLEGTFACEKIVDAIIDLVRSQPPRQLDPSKWIRRLRLRLRDYGTIAKLGIDYLIKKEKSNVEYRKQKFPGLNIEEINRDINLFQHLSSRFGDLSAGRLSGAKTCFIISKP